MGKPTAVQAARRLWGSWVIPCPTGPSLLQTVPVTFLGHRACSQLRMALGSNSTPVLPGMVCSSVVGEPPHCEVSPHPYSHSQLKPMPDLASKFAFP